MKNITRKISRNKIENKKIKYNYVINNPIYLINRYDKRMISFINLLIRGLEVRKLVKYHNKIIEEVAYFYLDKNLTYLLFSPDLIHCCDEQNIIYIPISNIKFINKSTYNDISILIKTDYITINFGLDTKNSREILIRFLNKLIFLLTGKILMSKESI